MQQIIDSKISPEEIRARLEDILPHVQKPGRYFAGEVGLVRKAWDSVKCRMALAFPDTWEIATANHGHQIIQYVINDHPDAVSERVYTPWPDMEARLRESGTPLYSLESYHPVREFDLFGFSLTHELCFTNILQMLDLSGLPLRSEIRGFPIVIGGGPVVFNPEPMAAFFDCFLIGDGEFATIEIIESIAAFRDKIDVVRGEIEKEIVLKKEILDSWGFIDGVTGIKGAYIPAHFTVNYNPDKTVSEIKNHAGGPDVITKALVEDLNDAPWVTNPPLPHMQGFENRVTVEPARGCTQGCRFCQAGMIYRPWRERNTETVVKQAEELLHHTGRTQQSFLALSLTDWEDLPSFLDSMKGPDRNYHLKISMPSSRVGKLTQEITDKLVHNKKGGLTLAVEAGTDRLRAVINKLVTDADIDRAMRNAIRSGWDYMKIYFMIGHPTETDEDVLGIIETAKTIQKIHQEMKANGETTVKYLRFRISASTFVPKSFTPFQWAEMIGSEETKRRQRLLIPLRKMKGVEYKSHDVDSTWIEGIMSRGDRRLGDVVERAYLNGARFDAWSDQCDRGAWEQAFVESDIDPKWYFRERHVDEALPWDHLDCGVEKEWLKKDWKRSLKEIRIPDCNDAVCLNCGMTNMDPTCLPKRSMGLKATEELAQKLAARKNTPTSK
ncbi:MAG TPA: TIGR03960 family B12-binding radical SAM protein [bacterium]|jgi:radical SAM family uncharacterized protein